LDEIWNTLSALSGAGPGRFYAITAQYRERESEAKFILFLLSGKQRTILQISRRPNFTKFERNTSIGVAMNPFQFLRGRFSKKSKK